MTILYIILALLIFGLLIFIHELGHFIVARLCGVKILEFAIGMGPTLVKWRSRKTGTKYALRLFPIGGFVNMLGENGMEAVQGDNGVKDETSATEPVTLINDGEPEEETEKDEPETVPLSEMDPELAKQAYCNQSAWKRILISLAGPAMNIILGFVLMLVLVLLAGHEAMATNMIGGFYIDYIAEEEQSGFVPGDSLYSVDGERIFTHADLTELVKSNSGKELSVVVLRLNEAGTQTEYVTFETTLDESILKFFRVPFSEQNGLQIDDMIVKVNSTSVHTYNELYYEITNQGYRELDLTVLREGEEIVLENVAFLIEEESGVEFGYVDIIPYRERNFDFVTVMKHTWFRSLSTVKMVYDSLFGMITGRFGVEAVSGPVGITKTIGEVAQIGFTSLLNLVVIISINLGVMNLLPIPALDGCHILIYLIELIRRKPMKKEVEGVINFVGLILLLTLAVIIAFKDIFTLI
ncbi:MAG: RIP metalloprotease RseP [Clostridia bacterium]|nr:RIP metalloprotease RseP [Clostridia bacterium]